MRFDLWILQADPLGTGSCIRTKLEIGKGTDCDEIDNKETQNCGTASCPIQCECPKFVGRLVPVAVMLDNVLVSFILTKPLLHTSKFVARVKHRKTISFSDRWGPVTGTAIGPLGRLASPSATARKLGVVPSSPSHQMGPALTPLSHKSAATCARIAGLSGCQFGRT